MGRPAVHRRPLAEGPDCPPTTSKLAAGPCSRAGPTTWAAIEAGDPDLVLVAPCGFGLAAVVEQARDVATHLPGRPVWAIDADGLVVRPGPRLVDGVEAIAAVLHPGAVPPSAAVARVSG